MDKTNSNKQSFLDKFTVVATKVGNEIHLRALRDAFSLIMPLFILAGFGVLASSVLFPLLVHGSLLPKFQLWGTLITNGTLNIAGLMLAPVIGYLLAKYRGYDNPITVAIINLACLVIVMPNSLKVVPTGATKAVSITGYMSFENLGTMGMFAGIIIGLVATELFVQLSKFKFLKIKMGEQVPPMVSESFSALLPSLIILSLFALIATLLADLANTDLIALVVKVVQEPLRLVGTSLVGMLFIYSVGNFLFTLGIHQAVVNGTLLAPLLQINMNADMAAFSSGKHIPYIMNNTLQGNYGLIGGTGNTIALLIAIFLFSKSAQSKKLAGLATVPGLFNINEPIIFGYPIVFNIPMMIPFVLNPVIGIVIAYYATSLHLMSHMVVMTPWTTPPLINAYLASAGDWRSVVVQIVVIAVNVIVYLPFMKLAERVAAKQAEMDLNE